MKGFGEELMAIYTGCDKLGSLPPEQNIKMLMFSEIKKEENSPYGLMNMHEVVIHIAYSH